MKASGSQAPRGYSLQDSVILFLLRLGYWASRFFIRLLLGRKRRDNLFISKELDFSTFLYKSLRSIGMERTLLKIHVPKYGCDFYCRANRDDFLFMTNHETEILEYFTPNEGDIVVDVGAHIGLYTILASKRVGSRGQVIAFEPEPHNFDILKRNLSLNQIQNVKTIGAAAYSEKTMLRLYLPEHESGRTIFNTVMQTRAGNNDRFVDVEAVPLDSVIGQLGLEKINWMKIDVEGAELEVLRGARNTLAKSDQVTLIIETHSSVLYKEVIEYLESLSFGIMYEKRNESGNWGHIVGKKSSFTHAPAS